MLKNNTDSRKKSLSEAFVNSFGAYPIGYGIGILVLPISVGWIHEDPLLANVFITLTYATVSFVRVYFLRRIFLKMGFDDNFIKLGIKLIQKIPRNFVKFKKKFSIQKDVCIFGKKQTFRLGMGSANIG